ISAIVHGPSIWTVSVTFVPDDSASHSPTNRLSQACSLDCSPVCREVCENPFEETSSDRTKAAIRNLFIDIPFCQRKNAPINVRALTRWHSTWELETVVSLSYCRPAGACTTCPISGKDAGHTNRNSS